MKKIDKKELHELFKSFKENNQSAYNKLYENYYNLVYGIVFSILKNKDNSEDVVHEVFTKLYKMNKELLPSENEASWLYTVTKNETFLFLKKSKPSINIDDVYEIVASSDEIDRIVDIEYYNKLISGLKEDERQIVSMKILSNFTFQKISQLLDVPIGTVQWKYYKAINSLKISISSLLGSVVALILIFARREFLNKKIYMNEANYESENVGDKEDVNVDIENDSSENVQLNNESSTNNVGNSTEDIVQDVRTRWNSEYCASCSGKMELRILFKMLGEDGIQNTVQVARTRCRSKYCARCEKRSLLR